MDAPGRFLGGPRASGGLQEPPQKFVTWGPTVSEVIHVVGCWREGSSGGGVCYAYLNSIFIEKAKPKRK